MKDTTWPKATGNWLAIGEANEPPRSYPHIHRIHGFHMWKGLCGMDMDLLKAIWNGVEMDMDPYVDPHVDFVAWFPTLVLLGTQALRGIAGLQAVPVCPVKMVLDSTVSSEIGACIVLSSREWFPGATYASWMKALRAS